MSNITEEQYRRLKSDVESAKSDADRAEGALTQLMQRLEEEFQCGNLKEAKAQLTQLTSKAAKAEEAFRKAMDTYEERWHPQ